jgi:Brp/Blh family beta-carotene 15,15'-monooxygenase
MSLNSRTRSHRLALPDDPERLALGLSRVALLLLTVVFAGASVAGVEVGMKTQAAVYLFGMVALNLPHGGYEHFENLRRRGVDFQGKYVGAYLGLVAAFVGLLFVAPVVGLSLMLAVAVAKGGFGGLRVADLLTGTDHLKSRPQRWLAAVVRGGAVMLVPMVFWPETFYSFASLMVSVFDPGALAASPIDPATTRPFIAAGYGLAVLTHVGLGFLRATDYRAWAMDAGETLLLIAYFAAVPVVIAVGLYFPLWYSMRQVARTVAVDPETEPEHENAPLAPEDPSRAIVVAWGALVGGAALTATVFVALFVLAPNPLAGAGFLLGGVALWSVFISVIALPHVVVGSFADRERGIWFVP